MSQNNAPTRAETKQQALALFQNNRLPEASELYVRLCQSDRTDAEAHYMLGVVSGKRKHLAEAADCFRQVIALQPQMVMAHCGLGAALKAQGKFAEAAESFRQAVQIKPDFANAYFDLGSVLFSLGNLNEAKEKFQQALRLKPTADAHFSIGNVQFAQGLMMEAIASFQNALKLNPARADIHNALGFTYHSMGSLHEALDSYQQALTLNPELSHVHNNLGKALIMLGRIDEAISCFQEALRINPDFIDAASGIVTAYERKDDYQKAAELLVPLLDRHSDHVGVAMAFARLCKQLGRCREAIDLLHKTLQQNNLPPLDKRQLHFSLGKLYDSMNSYDEAFAQYRSANSIQAPFYDPAKHAREIDAVISTFSANLLRHLPRASHVSERPIFIVGMPRSGTSLVEQILSSHPKVFGAGELNEISGIVAKMVNRLDAQMGFPRCIHKLTEEVANTLAQDYLGCLDAMSHDAVRVTDKMPHNFLHLGIISLLFPKARVIHCMRDPLDTCLSIYFQFFSAGHSYSCDLAHIGTHYREYQRLMAHWRKVVDISMLEIRYEDIVTNPDDMIQKLVEFCGLEWNPACLRFYENTRLVNTASYDQVRQPLHPKSIGRWKHYERHLGPLKTALGLQG